MVNAIKFKLNASFQILKFIWLTFSTVIEMDYINQVCCNKKITKHLNKLFHKIQKRFLYIITSQSMILE